MNTLEMTNENHFEFGFNQIPFSFRKSPEDQWFARFGKCRRPVGSFYEECLHTARLIGQKTNDQIWVLFSGGIDSEVAVRSFHAAGVPFKVAINRFKFDLNIHDICYAIATCEDLCVEYKFFDLDLEQFWKTQGIEYSMKTGCSWPRLTPTMWLMDQVDGYPVLGSGECFLEKAISKDYVPGVSPYEPSPWYLFEREKIASWYRILQVINKPGCPGFFQYTPEIIYSYLVDPDVQALCRSQVVGKLSTGSSKHRIYSKFFPLKERPKYTGFEKVPDLDRYFQDLCVQLVPHSQQEVKIEYEGLVRQMRS